jgi:putative ABC transport system permease protein
MYNLKNYFKISIRNLYREKTYALINLSGLSFAIACCLILAMYLRSEMTYDQHFEDHQNIYRIVEEFNNKGQLDAFAKTGSELAPLLASDYNEIESFVRFWPNPSLLISHQDNAYFWKNSYSTDSNIFNVFSHDIIYGDPATAMTEPRSAAVSESFSQRYFGDDNPVGKIITTEQGDKITIRLVFADLPENTHLKYDILFSRQPRNLGIERQRRSLWSTPLMTYLVLPESFNLTHTDSMFEDFYTKHMAATGEAQSMSMRYWLEPLADIHLYSNLQRDLPSGNLYYLYALMAVALFIIIVACINYTNLATARSTRRAKEVGMRKILGANRELLMIQFIAEALFFAILSMVIGIVIVELLFVLAPIEHYLGSNLGFNIIEEPQIMGWLLLFTLIIGLVSGLYPALYLSSWAPLSAMVGNSNSGKGNFHIRQFLVLVQFTVSIAVIACTLIMVEQMQFLSNKSLGFNKDNQIVIRMVGSNLLRKVPILKTELLKHPNINAASMHDQMLGSLESMGAFAVENRDGVIEANTINLTQVDSDFFTTLKIKLLIGRDFNQRLLTDTTTSFIVNESMVRTMGWTNAIGKHIVGGRVIGVVEDFHFQSLHNVVDPLAIKLFNDDWSSISQRRGALAQRYLTINISAGKSRETLSYIESQFADFDPKHPFEFKFLDDSLDALYQAEDKLLKLISIFSGICIFIACLGLFGLASFATEQRSKEISIRKILGASASQIILILSSSILKLVLVAGLIASVIAYLVMEQWLNGFAYRIDVDGLAFFLSTALVMLVAYITVALQSIKTALADPVDALRYE